MAGLPSPVTVADEYLAALHGVLTEIRDRLPEPKPERQNRPDGAVSVSEPATQPPPVKRAPVKRVAGRDPVRDPV